MVAIAVPIFTGALEKARLGVHRSNARALKSQAVAAILGSSEFEDVADGSQSWLVSSTYSFDDQLYTNLTVVNTSKCKTSVKNTPVGTMAICTNPTWYTSGGHLSDTYFTTESSGPAKDNVYTFGGCDDTIGRIGTSKGSVCYFVIVTEQDIDDAGVNLGA